MPDDPLIFVLDLCKEANTPCAKYLKSVLSKRGVKALDLDVIRNHVLQSQRTKFKTYVELNPDLTVSSIYTANVNELQRIKVSRLRLSSHNLAIEMGRWSRLNREQRLCSCGNIQTESHVICECPLTEPIRINSDLNFNSLSEFFKGNPRDICEFVNNCLAAFGQ